MNKRPLVFLGLVVLLAGAFFWLIFRTAHVDVRFVSENAPYSIQLFGRLSLMESEIDVSVLVYRKSSHLIENSRL